MNRWLKLAVVISVILVGLFGAAQLVQPERTNSPVDPKHTIAAQLGPHNKAAAIVARSCGDCHSNETNWAHLPKIAPMSWLAAYAVKDGRKVLNFSDWTAYPPETQRALLASSCKAASDGRMPGNFYTYLYPDAKLSVEDLAAICNATPSVNRRADLHRSE